MDLQRTVKPLIYLFVTICSLLIILYFVPDLKKIYEPLADLSIEVLGTGLALLGGFYWGKKIEPWLKEISYTGIIVEGKWEIIQDTKTASGSTLTVNRTVYVDLKQFANKLEGVAISTATIDGKISTIFYDLKGEIKDRFLRVYFDAKDQNKIAYSSFLLEILSDGSKMEGYRVYYGFKMKTIDSVKCEWRRI